jgi:hypothetical protein
VRNCWFQAFAFKWVNLYRYSAVALMDKITARLEKAKEWDQAVYNEVMFFPSHGGGCTSH